MRSPTLNLAGDGGSVRRFLLRFDTDLALHGGMDDGNIVRWRKETDKGFTHAEDDSRSLAVWGSGLPRASAEIPKAVAPHPAARYTS